MLEILSRQCDFAGDLEVFTACPELLYAIVHVCMLFFLFVFFMQVPNSGHSNNRQCTAISVRTKTKCENRGRVCTEIQKLEFKTLECKI